jgi:hypothetical protein
MESFERPPRNVPNDPQPSTLDLGSTDPLALDEITLAYPRIVVRSHHVLPHKQDVQTSLSINSPCE